MGKIKNRLSQAPHLALQIALAAFLTGPVFGEKGWMAVFIAVGLLIASLILEIGRAHV